MTMSKDYDKNVALRDGIFPMQPPFGCNGFWLQWLWIVLYSILPLEESGMVEHLFSHRS